MWQLLNFEVIFELNFFFNDVCLPCGVLDTVGKLLARG